MQAIPEGNRFDPALRPDANNSTLGLVLDSNVVLDLWLFVNPAVEALRCALREGRLRWLACPSMLTELGHLRARDFPARYPPSPEWLAPSPLLVEEPDQSAPWRSRDRSDQVFLDLAWQHRLPLWTLDGDLLQWRRKAARQGLRIETALEGLRRLGLS
jgi:uncharacterized protein